MADESRAATEYPGHDAGEKSLTNGCTCTHDGRKYASAIKDAENVVGVRASIKTHYGKLCCQGTTNTQVAYQVAYANVTKQDDVEDMIWAQSGWGRERDGGKTTITMYRYAEVEGTSYQVDYDVSNAPADGSTHSYQCDLDKSTGTWTFLYDDVRWKTFQDPGWANIMGDELQWNGEIYNLEDDMPGTALNKCSFTGCQFKVSGSDYQNAALTTDDVSSDDDDLWGAERVSGTAFNIWDKEPNMAEQNRIQNEVAAILSAMRLTGFENLPGITTSAQLTTVVEDETPYLSNQIKGRSAWRVEVADVSLSLDSTAPSFSDQYVRTFEIMVDERTGQILHIRSRYDGEAPDMRPAPAAAFAETQLSAAQEFYHGLPEEEPKISLLEALDIIMAKGIGNPLRAKEIEAVYVLHSTLGSEPRAVWAITLRGIPPRPPHGKHADRVPEWQRNHIRNVVDATTGDVLFATTRPQPEA